MKQGDKYILEIEEVQTYTKDGKPFELGRVAGFKALTLDNCALEKLTPYKERECYDYGYADGYNEGMSRAWLFARELFEMNDRDKIFVYGKFARDIIEEYSVQEAIKKYEDYIKEKEEAKKKAEEEIKVGDEINIKEYSDITAVATANYDDVISAVNAYGNVYDFTLSDREKLGITRTGRRFDIQRILDTMQIQPHDPKDDPDGNKCTTCQYDVMYDDDNFPCTDCEYAVKGGTGRSYYTKENE